MGWKKKCRTGKEGCPSPYNFPPGFLFRMITPFLLSFPAFTMRLIASEGRPQLVLPENPASALHIPAKLKSELLVPTGQCRSRRQEPLVWAGMQITSRCVREVSPSTEHKQNHSPTLPILLLQPHTPGVCIRDQGPLFAKFSWFIFSNVGFSVKHGLPGAGILGLLSPQAAAQISTCCRDRAPQSEGDSGCKSFPGHSLTWSPSRLIT